MKPRYVRYCSFYLNYDELKDRQKPLGTAHAILCCEDKVNEPFMIINADDFYGRDAFIQGANYLKEIRTDDFPHQYGMVGPGEGSGRGIGSAHRPRLL